MPFLNTYKVANLFVIEADYLFVLIKIIFFDNESTPIIYSKHSIKIDHRTLKPLNALSQNLMVWPLTDQNVGKID